MLQRDNPRVDRTTLIALDGKQTETAQNLRAVQAKRASDAQYVDALTLEIARQSTIVTTRYEHSSTNSAPRSARPAPP